MEVDLKDEGCSSTYKAAGGSRLLLHIADGARTRRVQPNLAVSPDEGMVNYLRHLLGNPQAVWTE